MRLAALMLVALLASACIHTTIHEDGSKEIETFGAATVTVLADGSVETKSRGVSEGLTDVLIAIPNAVLVLLGRAAL